MTAGGDHSYVLIVDDSLESVEVLGAILSREYEVRFASDGTEGLALATDCPTDIILLDVMMPGIDGYEVCRRLKADEATRDIPVIFLTSLESAAEEEYGLSLGAEDFIHKPFSAPVVMARVRNHLLLANTKRELKRHNTELEQLVAERTEQIVRRNQQLIAAQGATIAAFCSLAEVRDNETGNHIRRTQNYVRVLAEELRAHPRYRGSLSDETIEYLFKSAPLHDVGKVAIPDSILLKPGKLTAEEWAVMKRHCAIGCKAINAAAGELADSDRTFLKYAAEIAYGHHERWNGRGYPEGLAGDQIPLSARLMAVADVYDALTTRRVYKEPYPHDRSIEMMVSERGQHFEPVMIDALQAIADHFQAIASQFEDAAVDSAGNDATN